MAVSLKKHRSLKARETYNQTYHVSIRIPINQNGARLISNLPKVIHFDAFAAKRISVRMRMENHAHLKILIGIKQNEARVISYLSNASKGAVPMIAFIKKTGSA